LTFVWIASKQVVVLKVDYLIIVILVSMVSNLSTLGVHICTYYNYGIEV